VQSVPNPTQGIGIPPGDTRNWAVKIIKKITKT
jgi:hypothetical protein